MSAAAHVPLRNSLQVTDDAQCDAKSKKVGQPIQRLPARIREMFSWLEEQTPETIAEFTTAHGMTKHMSASLLGTEPEHPYRHRYTFHELPDAFGPTTSDPSYTAIVCSEETKPGCDLINTKRVEKGMLPLAVYIAPLLKGHDGEKLSSTAIRASLAAPDETPAGATTSAGSSAVAT